MAANCDDPACPGWFINQERFTIERCDQCKQFDSDDEAIQHVQEYWDQEHQEREKDIPNCQHEPDWSTARLAEGTADIIDVWCPKCGKLGSFTVSPEDINWE